METHQKLYLTSGDTLPNPKPYQRLVGKLIYLTITRSEFSYIVHALSKFMHKPTSIHYQAVVRLLRYLKGTST